MITSHVVISGCCTIEEYCFFGVPTYVLKYAESTDGIQWTAFDITLNTIPLSAFTKTALSMQTR
jgi:hypothetical protein